MNVEAQKYVISQICTRIKKKCTEKTNEKLSSLISKSTHVVLQKKLTNDTHSKLNWILARQCFLFIRPTLRSLVYRKRAELILLYPP